MNYAASSCLGVISILKICSMYQDLNFWRTPMDAHPLSIGAKDKGDQKGSGSNGIKIRAITVLNHPYLNAIQVSPQLGSLAKRAILASSIQSPSCVSLDVSIKGPMASTA